MTKPSAFAHIHRLIREGKSSRALSELLDPKTGRIRVRHAGDCNHAWYLVGDINFRKGDFSRAAKAFRNAINRWPEDSEAMMAIANCYSEMRMPRWSVHYLKKAISLQPKNAELFYNLGNAYFDLADYDAAIKAYVTACRNADRVILAKCRKNIALAKSLKATKL